MTVRYGLRVRFLLLAGTVLLASLALVAAVLQRQDAAQEDVRALSLQSMHELAAQRLLSRGEAVASQLADSLVKVTGIIPMPLVHRTPSWSQELTYEPVA